MYSLTSDVTKRLDTMRSVGVSDSRLAKNVYDFVLGEISYGDKRRTTGYATAKEVWRNKEGVCGEMSYLYVSAARYLGLQSSYVSVSVDESGKPVSHACAAVWVPDVVFVDIAYQTFDITHQKYELRSDRDVLRNFHNWRNTE